CPAHPRGRSPTQSLFVLLGRNSPFYFSRWVLSTTPFDTASSPSTQHDPPNRPPQGAMTSSHHLHPSPASGNLPESFSGHVVCPRLWGITTPTHWSTTPCPWSPGSTVRPSRAQSWSATPRPVPSYARPVPHTPTGPRSTHMRGGRR